MQDKKNVCMEVKFLSNAIRRSVCANNPKMGATGMHGWLIGYLYDNIDNDIFQRDIETKFNIRRSTVTGILQRMEKKGMITRIPVKHDARLKKIVLTQEAVETHEQIVKSITSLELQLIDGISENDISLFFNIISKMKNNIENKDCTQEDKQ